MEFVVTCENQPEKKKNVKHKKGLKKMEDLHIRKPNCLETQKQKKNVNTFLFYYEKVMWIKKYCYSHVFFVSCLPFWMKGGLCSI